MPWPQPIDPKKITSIVDSGDPPDCKLCRHDSSAASTFPLLSPEAAIDPSEGAVSINAAMAMRDQFAEDSPVVRTFFEALVEILTGSGRKRSRGAVVDAADRVAGDREDEQQQLRGTNHAAMNCGVERQLPRR
jgi:hypothetical protein